MKKKLTKKNKCRKIRKHHIIFSKRPNRLPDFLLKGIIPCWKVENKSNRILILALLLKTGEEFGFAVSFEEEISDEIKEKMTQVFLERFIENYSVPLPEWFKKLPPKVK